MKDKRSIFFVAGPTASGKTSHAVALAQEVDGEVISVDSRQVYRMLDIGTEKATPEEMGGVPHHLIDIRDPKDTYSAGDFVSDAERLIADITHRGKVPILAGGTHFYFDALLYGLPPETPPDEDLRTSLEARTNEELLQEISEKDPHRAERLDPKNRRRLVRALEIIKKHLRVPERPQEPKYEGTWIVLNPARDELKERIAQRLLTAFERGLIDEVRRVRDYVGDERLNELGLEYRIVGEYLRGERDEASLIPALNAKLWHYARRQKAWLRKLGH